MKFTLSDLKSLAMAVRKQSPRERTTLSAMLHRRQPEICEIIDWVGTDPRCFEAHRFCITFCALAFKQAEGIAGQRLPSFPGPLFQEVAGFITRDEVVEIGKRACQSRKRILLHVLNRQAFDEEDVEWLSTTISTFLYFVERSVRRERRGLFPG